MGGVATNSEVQSWPARPPPASVSKTPADRTLPASSASRAIYTISDLIFVDLLRVRRRFCRRLARSSNSRINARQRTRALLHRRDDAQPTHFFHRPKERMLFLSPLFPYLSLFVFPPRWKRTLSILASKPSGKSLLGKKWSGNRSPRKNQQEASTSRSGVVEPSYIRLLSFGDAPNAPPFGVDCELNDMVSVR